MKKKLFKEVDDYLNELFVPKDRVMKGVLKSLVEGGLPLMNISPIQGQLLYTLASLCKAKRILEIGTLGGYSAIWMAKALPERGKLITIEANPKHASIAQKNINKAKLDSKISIRQGKALEVLPQLIKEGEGPFDMIFIDADKPPYVEYFKLCLQMSKLGTLIIADNVIRMGNVIDKNQKDERVIGIRRFNKMLGKNPNAISTIIQTVGSKKHDGMALSVVKKVPKVS